MNYEFCEFCECWMFDFRQFRDVRRSMFEVRRSMFEVQHLSDSLLMRRWTLEVERWMLYVQFLSVVSSPFPTHSSHFRENLALWGMIPFSWEWSPRSGVDRAEWVILFLSLTLGLHPGHIILTIITKTNIIDRIPVTVFMMNNNLVLSKAKLNILKKTENSIKIQF